MPRFSDKSVSRRTFLATGAAATVAASRIAHAADEEIKVNVVGLTPSTTDAQTVARLRVANTAKITALQLTDVHFFCTPMLPRRDEQTLEDLPKLVELAKPDVLLVTGDLWHDNPDGKGAEYMAYAVEQIESLGVPWMFTWGNHDQLDDYAMGHDYLRNAKRSLYRGGPGSGNYRVELIDGNEKPVWEFLCLNSSNHGLMDAQREWLATEAGNSSAPGFTLVHIPLKQHLKVWESGDAAGIKMEGVSHWEEDGTSLATIREATDLRAVFSGHDHVNNYSGVYDGVEMVYGHATGTGGYGGNKLPKGAKKIEIDAGAGIYRWETILPDGMVWQPAAGFRAEDIETSPFGDPKIYYKAKRKKSGA